MKYGILHSTSSSILCSQSLPRLSRSLLSFRPWRFRKHFFSGTYWSGTSAGGALWCNHVKHTALLDKNDEWCQGEAFGSQSPSTKYAGTIARQCCVIWNIHCFYGKNVYETCKKDKCRLKTDVLIRIIKFLLHQGYLLTPPAHPWKKFFRNRRFRPFWYVPLYLDLSHYIWASQLFLPSLYLFILVDYA